MTRWLRKHRDPVGQIQLKDVIRLLSLVSQEHFVPGLQFDIGNAASPVSFRNWEIIPSDREEKVLIDALLDDAGDRRLGYVLSEKPFP